MLRGHIAVLLLLFSGFQVLFGQGCALRLYGTVVDGETGQAFESVSVGIKNNAKGVLTDSLGRFEFSGLCHGTYTLLVSAIGYKSYEATYHLDKDRQDKIVLHTDTCGLPSVTVFGQKEEDLATFSKSTLDAKQLEKLTGLTLGETLKELPGVTTFRTGTSISKPVIHGLYGNRIVIVNAGLRQEGQQWGNEHAPEIDPFVANKLTVIKGAAGVRYGPDALAGVILVEPKPLPAEKGIAGAVSVAGFSNNRQATGSAMLEGRFWEKMPISWRMQGTLKKAGNTKTPNYYQANTGFEEANFSWALGIDKKRYGVDVFYSQFNTTLGIFAGSHIGSVSDLENAINRSQPAVISDFSYDIDRPFQKVAHELFRAKGWWAFPSLGKLSLTYGRQFNDRAEFDKFRNSQDNVSKDNPQLHYKLTTHSVDLLFEHKEIKRMKGSVGVSYLRQSNIWLGRFLIPNFESGALGVFWLEKWQRKRWLIEAGIRHDTKQLTTYLNESGRVYTKDRHFQCLAGTIGARYQLSHHLTWNANVGSSWRPPTINELYSNGLHHGAAAIEHGDENLQLEQGYKALSSLEFSSPKVAMEITAYYNSIHNYIYLKPDNLFIQTIRGAFPVYTYTQTDARFWGSDFSLDYSFTKAISAIGKASLVWAKDVKQNAFLINIPPVRYSLGLKIAPQKWAFATRTAPYVSITCLRVEKQTRVEEGSDYAPPPPAYTLFDMEMGMNCQIGKQKISISLQVSNVFNIAYRDYMDRFRYYTDEMGRNIAIRVTVPFQIYSP